MKNLNFEANKLKRAIRYQGRKYTFFRDTLDEFKEPTSTVVIAKFNGVFHQLTQHISVVGTEDASVAQKNTPYIMAPYDDAKYLAQGDYTIINGTKYLVNALTNIGGYCVALDISLEAVV